MKKINAKATDIKKSASKAIYLYFSDIPVA